MLKKWKLKTKKRIFFIKIQWKLNLWENGNKIGVSIEKWRRSKQKKIEKIESKVKSAEKLKKQENKLESLWFRSEKWNWGFSLIM